MSHGLPVDEVYDSLSQRDVERFIEFFSEDAELHDLPEMPDSDVYRGREAIARWTQDRVDISTAWQWDATVLYESSNSLLARVHVSVNSIHAGVPVEMDVFHIVDVRDGRIAKVRAFATEEAARKASEIPAL